MALNDQAAGRKLFAADIQPVAFETNMRPVYEFMLAMHRDGESVDFDTVTQKLFDREDALRLVVPDLIEKAGPSAKGEHWPISLNFDYYLNLLLEKGWRERTVAGLALAKEQVSAGREVDAIRLARDLQNKPSVIGHAVTGDTLVDSTFIDIDERLTEKTPRGVSTPFASLDEATHGWAPGSLNILAGRPSHGKTSLAIWFALHALRCLNKVCFFSLEMTTAEIMKKFFAAASEVPTRAMIRGEMTEGERDKVYKQSARFRRGLTVYEKSLSNKADTIGFIENEVIKRVDRGEADLVIIDYVQLIQASSRSFSEYERISEVTRRLKQLALETRTPIVGLAQIKRAMTQMVVRPRLDDLKGSGSIEQDADTVMLIHSDPGSSNYELIVAKSRHGHTCDIPYTAAMAINRFQEGRNA